MVKNCNLLNPVIPASKHEIICKEAAYMTKADEKKFLKLATEMQAIARENSDIKAVASEFVKYFHKSGEIWRKIEKRYIKSRGRQGLLEDAKEIIAAIDQEDFLRWIEGVDEKEKDPFKNCYYYIRLCIIPQIRGLGGEEDLRPDIEKRVSIWYEKPQGLYIPPLQLKKQPIDEYTANEFFGIIRQGPATNIFSKIEIRHNDKRVDIDPVTGVAKARRGDFGVAFPGFTELNAPDLSQSAHQLLDMAVCKSTEAGGAQSVTFTIDEYMQKRGLKDRKEARKQAEESLKALHMTKLSFKGKSKGKIQDYFDINILDAQGIRNGVISVTFGTTLFNVFSNYPVMPYPAELWKFNRNKNPNSYYLLRKIAEQKNMNRGKKNEDVIAVKTLLENCPALPKYEEVIRADKAVTRRIIERFERDLDAINIIKEWHYCHSKDTPLTDEELQNMDYKTFITLYVKIDWGGQYLELPRRKKPVKKKSKSE